MPFSEEGGSPELYVGIGSKVVKKKGWRGGTDESRLCHEMSRNIPGNFKQ
jgi:hypothetical protein